MRPTKCKYNVYLAEYPLLFQKIVYRLLLLVGAGLLRPLQEIRHLSHDPQLSQPVIPARTPASSHEG